MRISYRMADYGQPQQGEHLENVGGPKVTIEPGFQDFIQNAVDFVNSQYPDMLKEVTDIYGHVEGGGMFGEYKSDSPHSIYVDIQNIESEVRNQMQGQDEEAIKDQIKQQIIKTIVHEATHKSEYSSTGNTSEAGPEAAERAVEPLFEGVASISCRTLTANTDLETKVQQTMGEASVSLWSEDPVGVFESEKAMELSSKIVDYVEDNYDRRAASYRRKIAEMSAKAYRPPRHPDDPLEARVRLLEDKVEMLRTELNAIQTR